MGKINYKLIDKYDYVSFDIFDTLLKRMLLTSNNVFCVVANIYKKKYGKELPDFETKRTTIEFSLWKKTKEGKFTLNHIYKELENIYPKEVCIRLKNIELEVEKINICRNSDFYPVFKYIKENKKVIITSDMYLSEEIISEILKKAGIDGYDKLYISGEKKGSKANGKIFDIISHELHNRKIIHIGNSLKDDFIKPRLKKWCSVKITPYLQPYFCNRNNLTIVDSLVIGLSDSKSLHKGDFWENFGYSVLGPLLLAFIKWIKEETVKDNVDQIIFLARDGYIVKMAFDLFFDHRYHIDYMYVSRRSVLPVMTEEKSELKDIIKNINFRKVETLKTVLMRLGIEEIDQVENIKIKRKDLYAEKYNGVLMPYFSKIKKNMLIQKRYIADYVNNMFYGKKPAVIDVGWHGTIQDCLQYVSKKSIKGYYLGLEKNTACSKKAFITGLDSNIIPYTRGVFETCFTALHPSTKAYEKLCDEIKPVFELCEYSSDTKVKIRKIQNSALEYINDYKQISKKLMLDDECLDNRLISDMFVNFCINPKKKDAEKFGDIEFNDIMNRKLIDYKGGAVWVDLKAFMDSDWKAGYIRRVLGDGIPYGKAFAFLNSFRKRV